MPVDRADFENLSEADLQELVATNVPEGLRFEFKRDTYGNGDSDKREMLKDVSALLNTHGGHLILGVSATAGVATELPGTDCADGDQEILRLEQSMRAGIEPRPIGIRSKWIQLANGRLAFVIRIPRSWNAPHRVCAQGVNRFYLRNSNGVHEASMDELRVLFSEATTAIERARAFRDERLGEIIGQRGIRPLQGDGRLIVHIVPMYPPAGTSVDLSTAMNMNQSFLPLGANWWTPRFNFDGCINERGGPENFGYTQLFRTGALEATLGGILRTRDDVVNIPGLGLEGYFFARFEHYLNGLRDLQVSPPLVVMVTLEGVEGAFYRVVEDVFDEPVAIDRPTLLLPECIINEYGTRVDYHKAIRPAYDALWNAVGYPRSLFFNDAGEWVGRGV